MSKLVVGNLFSKYKTLEQAVAASHNGDTIVIKKRIVLKNSITIDRSLQIVSQHQEVIATPKYKAAFYISNNATLEFNGINFDIPAQSQAIKTENGYCGSLTLRDGSMTHIGKLVEREFFPSVLINGAADATNAASLKLDHFGIDYLSATVREIEVTNGSVLGDPSTPQQSTVIALMGASGLQINNTMLTRIILHGGHHWQLGQCVIAGDVWMQSSAAIITPLLIKTPFNWKFAKNYTDFDDYVEILKWRSARWNDRGLAEDLNFTLLIPGMQEPSSVHINRPSFFTDAPNGLERQGWFSFQGASVTINGGTIEKNSTPSRISGGGLDFEHVIDKNKWIIDEQNKPELANGDSKSSLFKEKVAQVTQTSNKGTTDFGALSTLDSMIGLSRVKKATHDLIDHAEINRLRSQKGSTAKVDLDLHTLFLGNAGTGKTTVATIMAQALYEHKVLSTNKFMRVTAKDLISENVGQTAPQTHQIILKALDGVLLIDEAYLLTADPSNKLASYNAEALGVIVDDAEEYKDRLMIIMAGYTTDMQRMFKVSNQGLKSRFPNRIIFDDYSPKELIEILIYRLKGAEAIPANKDAMTSAAEGVLANGNYKDRATGNGRYVRTYINALTTTRDARLKAEHGSHVSKLTLQQLETFTQADVKNAVNAINEDASVFEE